MAKLSIVVLQYNKSEHTLACLEALRALSAGGGSSFGGMLQVVVVDNGSEVQHLKNVEFWIASQKMSNYELLISNENLGYSGGNNLGIKKALEDGAEKILILNNDVVVEPDFLDRLLEVDSDIVGLEELIIKGWFYLFYYLPGHALLIKKRVFEKIGLFDERNFLYYEDVEFCERARKAEFYLSIAKSARTSLKHTVSASTKALGPADLLYYHTRNLLLLYNTHVTMILPIWYSLQTWRLWTKLKQHIKIAFGRDVEISKAILQGIKDYEHGRFGQRKNGL